MIHPVLEPRAFFPTAVDTSVPVKTAAKAAFLEGLDEDLKILGGEKRTMRTIGQAVEKSADRTSPTVERMVGETLDLPRTLIKELCKESK